MPSQVIVHSLFNKGFSIFQVSEGSTYLPQGVDVIYPNEGD